MRILFSLLFCFCLFAAPATAQDSGKKYHALAMHGDAAMPADFTHFPFVNPNAPKGGVLRQSVIGTFDSLNPHIVRGKAAQGMNLVFGRLMARSWDEPFTMYPYIAESVVMPDDRSWIIFNIDRRARFSDGSPLTAEDVLFSFEILKEKGRPNFRRIYGMVDKASIIDPYKIRFDFDRAMYDRETALIVAMMPIYSKKHWQDRAFDQTTLDLFIGSGPYRVATVEAGRRIVFERDTNYWAKDIPSLKGHYNFDRMVFDYYREENIALEAFRAGQIDIRAENDVLRWVNVYDSMPVRRGAQVVKKEIEHGRPDAIRAIIFNTRRDLFADMDIRKALSLALNFEWLNQNLFSGQYRRANSIFPNAILADGRFSLPQHGDTNDFRNSLREAAELLSQKGWNVRQNRLMQDSRHFDFEILLDNPEDEKIALEYARNLRRLGIHARVRTVDASQFTARLDSFDFDMVINRWSSTLSPGNEQLFYWSSQAAESNGTRNYPGIKSQKIDDLAAALANAKTYDDLVKQARALDYEIMQGHYFIPLHYSPFDRYAYWDYLGAPDTNALYGTVLETWWDKRAKTNKKAEQ